MKAVTWQGKHDIRVKDVPDPKIQDPRDIILRVTTTAICGSDLHLYDGFIPTMKDDDILGHEFMGVVEEAGPNHPLKKGDRVLIPFQIACGTCHYCRRMETALCDTTNPEGAEKMQEAYGQAAAGLRSASAPAVRPGQRARPGAGAGRAHRARRCGERV